ncbi:MAG: universal stress protein [Candidatus Brocadiales bacterium]|nr:universal stress protein [Candidatus Bathyanammoxibius sp.]MCQ4575049.1 universal stress protein [Candidatus Bathyanammoxibius amoris]
MENVLLIISTQRLSCRSINHAIDLTRKRGLQLMVLFVMDSKLPESIFRKLEDEAYLGYMPSEEAYRHILEEYEERGKLLLSEIKAMADKEHVPCKTVFREGDFFEECEKLLAEEKMQTAIVTRKKRSSLSRFILGSDINKLMEMANCPFEIFDEE